MKDAIMIWLFTLFIVSMFIIGIMQVNNQTPPYEPPPAIVISPEKPITPPVELPMKEWVYNMLEHKLGQHNADKAMRLIHCESTWNPEAVGYNKGSVDLGLFQINTRYHPEVKPSCSLDYKCATREFIRIFNKRGWNEWTCGRS